MYVKHKNIVHFFWTMTTLFQTAARDTSNLTKNVGINFSPDLIPDNYQLILSFWSTQAT
jgi:hypothetical protein